MSLNDLDDFADEEQSLPVGMTPLGPAKLALHGNFLYAIATQIRTAVPDEDIFKSLASDEYQGIPQMVMPADSLPEHLLIPQPSENLPYADSPLREPLRPRRVSHYKNARTKRSN